MDRIKFVIVEKSYLVRKGIASIINRIDHATVVKELDSLDEINSSLLKHQPDFLVINQALTKESLVYLNSGIRADLENIGIGIISGNEAFLNNKPVFRETINILDERDEIFRKFEALANEKISTRPDRTQTAELSEREKTILAHVARGLTNKEIAQKLFLSAHTVITHRKNITNKLGIKTISGLTVYAILNNLINIGDLE